MKMVLSCKKRDVRSDIRESGFTLVELMIVLVVSGLVMAAVVAIYTAQSRSYSERDDVANIQQDLRGALVLLPAEIRLAGCDPLKSYVPRIDTATRNSFRFTMDTKDNSNPRLNVSDGQVNGDEDIAYGFTADTDNDGIVDNGGAAWTGTGSLGRQIGNAGVFEPLADNIEALEFNYLIDDDNNESTPLVPTLAPFNPNQIRAVQISLLARAANPAQGFINTNTYTTASGVVWNPPDDNFRRRMVVTSVQCRNMGY